MTQPQKFYEQLVGHGVGLFTGVPDSLLKDFCAYVDDHGRPGQHVIAANEGNAIALAAGYHMASGNIGVVYMQNSGLGNAVNPLTSLADAEVYKIPMVLVVGWRGEPGVKDEPQHVKQGKITHSQLELLGLPTWIMDANTDTEKMLAEVFQKVKATNAPVAILVRKDSFAGYKSVKKISQSELMTREQALQQIFAVLDPKDLVVSTTGKTSREVFEMRVQRGEAQRDFLTVGGMGHTASIAMGVALVKPNKRVVCLDGDGSVLMHMGALPVIGSLKPSHFVHVLLNNAAHESVGGQPTVAGSMDFASISKACGYSAYFCINSKNEIASVWKKVMDVSGPVFVEIKIRVGSREDLARPTSTPEQNKLSFMKTVQD